MGRTLVCAVDDSPTSHGAAVWLAVNVARPGDELHLVTVAPPPTITATPAVPIATAGAVAAMSFSWEQQRKEQLAHCRHQLMQLVHKLPENVQERLEIHRHVLPAAGGASGLAESIVAFCHGRSVDLAACGSRGLGAFKSTFLSLVGLGSVSSYLVHNLHCPVAVCRGREVDQQPRSHHKVMVALDDSDNSKKALKWALHNAVGREDELHLVSVALPIPYPVVADDAVASAVLEAEEYDAAVQDSLHYAREIVTNAVDQAKTQVDPDRIFFRALAPEGGASDVGESLVHYAKANAIDLAVLGARGMGSFKRAMMSFVGLGSVSDYVVHHLDTPVVVVKQ